MEEDELKSRTFSKLKGYCLDLLSILQSKSKSRSAATLPQFLYFLRSCSSNVLQPFFDYTLFPLLLLLDASVACRSSEKVNSEEKYAMPNGPKNPLKVGDSVAEGMLQCLEELLKKCHLGSLDQMVLVLKKLTYGALLSPSEASEEFREGIIRCFRAVLLNLRPCTVESCTCKQAFNLPALLKSKDMQDSFMKPSKFDEEPKECLLAFLQSQIASAAVGHWLSLLLKTAETEAARGHRGSAKLRAEAFFTFRVLVAKVGTADALAFFLPGVVSQLAKVLHVSRTMISGAAGSLEVFDHAIRGLGELLMIVLQDDANLSVLDLPLNDVIAFHPAMEFSTHSLLEELLHLPINAEDQNKIAVENSLAELVESETVELDFKEKKSPDLGDVVGSLHVNRTKDWLSRTSGHINKLLSATFPHICVHPSAKVRHGLLAAIQGLLSKCSYTLKESRLTLLESLCVLVCDDSEVVSADAQKFLEYLFSSSAKHQLEKDVSDIFTRLIEKLPKLMLGSEESLMLSHAQQLLAVMYYSGPQLVVDHVLHSPVTAARFLDVFGLCLSQNLAFSGSLKKLLIAKPLSMGYLESVNELKTGSSLTNGDQAIINPALPEPSKSQDKCIQSPVMGLQKTYELPRMPPWFVHVGSQKIYEALAGILRLVGLSMMADFRTEGSSSVITDIPLGYFRKLVAEIRLRDCSNEGLQSWYNRTGSGQLLRQASTAACILNEMIFGMSDQAVDVFTRVFHKARTEKDATLYESAWRICKKEDARIQLIDCVGSVLHEYLSPEVWDLPVEQKSAILQLSGENENITLHFLRDTAMLHQVIIEGIGIFNMCLGKDFDCSGFLHSSLYLLLENLSCSNFQIGSAADGVLRVLSATSGHPTVGHLVVTNSDYIIDSICRQLRHLDLNRHVPNLLGAMLSYIGVAHKILPLLEEPMRSVCLELEILGRHQRPHLTIPFLKAVAEIVKASKREACSMITEAGSYRRHVNSKLSDLAKKSEADSCQTSSRYDDYIDSAPTGSGADLVNFDMHMEKLEDMLFKLNDSREFRRTVGSIAGSCLIAATPLLASVNQSACLLALGIVEDGIATLADVEEAYRQEKGTKEALERVIKSHSFHDLEDGLDSVDETDENRLLPAMNKLWPFLVVCIRSTNPVAVRRCLHVVSTVVKICGGDFFSRRFHTDGAHFWKLLSTSPFQKKSVSKEEKGRLLLPYRSTSRSVDNPVAEVSNVKVQEAMLNMIADISQNKRSTSALQAVLKKVSGLVVGVACSSITRLRDASVNALLGLASVDPDLIWLLLADVYYSLKKNTPSPPTSDFPEMSQILPPPPGSSGYLYVQYGGQSFGFDVDSLSVETVIKKLHSLVFTSQMYS